MQAEWFLDSTFLPEGADQRQLMCCVPERGGHYSSRSSLRLKLRLEAKCGCSSVVEHLLAKEDVASSSLVTRSILRLE